MLENFSTPKYLASFYFYFQALALPTQALALPTQALALPTQALTLPTQAFALSTAPSMPSSNSSVFSRDASLITDLTSLKLMGVPSELNNRDFLRRYYSKFGDLKRVHSNPAAMSAIVTFLKHVCRTIIFLSLKIVCSNSMTAAAATEWGKG